MNAVHRQGLLGLKGPVALLARMGSRGLSRLSAKRRKIPPITITMLKSTFVAELARSMLCPIPATTAVAFTISLALALKGQFFLCHADLSELILLD